MSETLFAILDLPENLDQKPYDFTWEGRDAHLAPDKATPLKDSLLGKTNCSLLLISASSMIWAAKRISLAADVTKILQVAETELCFQSSPLYFDRASPSFFAKDCVTVGESVVETIAMEGTTDFRRSPGGHHSLPPVQEVADIISLTRHVVDPKFEPAYKKWLEGLIARLNKIAPNPQQSRADWADLEGEEKIAFKKAVMGPPLPLEAANMSREFDMLMRAELYSAFLRSVDWRSNPYLASPDKMRSLGFEGEPYT